MVLPMTIALAVVTVVGVAVLVWDQRRTPLPSDAARVANRHAAIAAAVAWACVIGALVASVGIVLMSNADLTGRVMALMPADAAVVLLTVHAAGELTWPRPRGTVREARLAPRDTDDVAPRWLHRVTWVWASALVASLVVFGVVADGPRSVAVTTPSGLEYSAAPFPGWWYGVPLIAAVLAIIVGVELVLRLVTLRPAVAGVPASWDLALRRRSARRVLRGAQLPIALTAAGVFWLASITRANATSDVCLVLAWVFGVGGCLVAVAPGRDFRAARTESAASGVAVAA